MSMVVCPCIDQRESMCFAEFVAGRCQVPLIGNTVLKAECCCSIGAAWSDQCQFCPRPNTGNTLQISLSYKPTTWATLPTCTA